MMNIRSWSCVLLAGSLSAGCAHVGRVDPAVGRVISAARKQATCPPFSGKALWDNGVKFTVSGAPVTDLSNGPIKALFDAKGIKTTSTDIDRVCAFISQAADSATDLKGKTVELSQVLAQMRPSPLPLPEAAPQPAEDTVGEKVPSEDPVIKDLHSMGLLAGRLGIFRSACPVRDIAKAMAGPKPSPAELAEARGRMRHLRGLGVRTVISLQDPGPGGEGKDKGSAAAIDLERAAAQKAGLKYVLIPLRNAGPDSLQTRSDQEVLKSLDAIGAEILKYADKGGVLFHCSAGHDRTGLVAGFLRVKYQRWPADEAVAEMRRYGHNWKKFSPDGGVSSWHERHLRAIADILQSERPAQ